MGDHDHQEQADDDLPPSLVLWDVITKKIYPFVIVTGFGYHITSSIKHFGFYDFIRISGLLAKGLLTGEYNKNPNPDTDPHTFKGYLREQQPKLSPKRLASLTYSGTPDLKGLKDIVETLPIGLDSCAANSIMPMNKPARKKIQWLSGALISCRVVEV